MMRTHRAITVVAFAGLLAAGCGLASGCGAGTTASSSDVIAPAAAGATSQPAAPVATATATATPTPPSASAISSKTFSSASLGVDKRYFIYLPAGYASSSRRYPVVYMLHGLGGSEDNWPSRMGLGVAADKLGLEAIVVMPDGDDSFYSNNIQSVPYDKCLAGTRFGKKDDMRTYCVKTPRYEDYIARDLVAHIDGTYRTIARRSGRAIGGLSMGGFGALMLAMRHPDLYSAVASHSGVASLLYRGPYPYVTGKAQIADDPKPWIKSAGNFGVVFERAFGTDIANWRAHDPATLGAKLAPGQLAIYLDCGTEDEFRLDNGMQHLHDVLKQAGVAHTYHLVPGRHNTAFWRDRIGHSLAFFRNMLSRTSAAN